MSCQVLLPDTFRKQYSDLKKEEQKLIKTALYDPRQTADITLTATNLKKYRLRVGDFRIIYLIDSDFVKVIEVFRKGKGY